VDCVETKGEKVQLLLAGQVSKHTLR